MPNVKFPPNFNPNAAILLSQAEFKITVDLKTGAMSMVTNRPDMNFLAVIDILTSQIQAIVRQSLQQATAGNPGFLPPGGDKKTESDSGGKPE